MDFGIHHTTERPASKADFDNTRDISRLYHEVIAKFEEIDRKSDNDADDTSSSYNDDLIQRGRLERHQIDKAMLNFYQNKDTKDQQKKAFLDHLLQKERADDLMLVIQELERYKLGEERQTIPHKQIAVMAESIYVRIYTQTFTSLSEGHYSAFINNFQIFKNCHNSNLMQKFILHGQVNFSDTFLNWYLGLTLANTLLDVENLTNIERTLNEYVLNHQLSEEIFSFFKNSMRNNATKALQNFVDDHSTDLVNPVAVLDELERLGLIKSDHPGLANNPL